MLTKNDLKSFEKLLKPLKNDLAATKADVTGIKADTAATKAEIKAVKKDLAAMEARQDKKYATKKDIEGAVKDAASQILEAIDRGFAVTAGTDDIQEIQHEFRDHEKRINKLEQAVLPA